jgi:RNase P subunit RPR2
MIGKHVKGRLSGGEIAKSARIDKKPNLNIPRKKKPRECDYCHELKPCLVFYSNQLKVVICDDCRVKGV